MRGYWFIGNHQTGHYQFCQLLEMVEVERRKIVERYCGRQAEEVDLHIWQEFFEDCFGARRADESVGNGECEQLIYYIDKDTTCVRSYSKNTLEARLIRLFKPKLKLK